MVGERLTSRNRLARMLMQQEQAAPQIQSHTQGLASMLRQGLAGYMQGQDERAYSEAMRAQGLPQLQGMQDNPYAMRRAADIQAQQTARAQGLEDFETQLKLKQQYAKQSAPKTVKTGEGMFILNPDGTLGRRLGSAKADTEIIMGGELKKGFRPVYDPQTGQQTGAEPIPGGSEDPAQIQASKEAERKAALNVKNLEKLPGRRSQIFASVQSAPALKESIKTAIEASKSPLSSGIAQQVLGGVAVGPAFELERALDTIKANVGFGELIRIKEAGGTLGALSEMENRLLQAVQGAMDARQDPKTLVPALERIQQIADMNLEQKKREFKEMYPDSARPWEQTSGELPYGVTEEDISHTMQVHGLTREQVLQRLGGG